jgi:hypothetical protein
MKGDEYEAEYMKGEAGDPHGFSPHKSPVTGCHACTTMLDLSNACTGLFALGCLWLEQAAKRARSTSSATAA